MKYRIAILLALGFFASASPLWADYYFIPGTGGGGGGSVNSVSAGNSTLTISPTSGNVVAALNLAAVNTWTGAQTFSAITTFGSGYVDNSRVATATPVTVATSDSTIFVKLASPAAVTVNLPPTPTTGQRFTIKDAAGNANADNITITPNSGTIDGAATFVMNTNYQSKTIEYNGSEWSIL